MHAEAGRTLLLALERPEEALAAYRASEAIWPGRFNTLVGAARAAKASGDEASHREYLGRLLAVAGDSGRDTVRDARMQLGRARED